MNDDNDGVVKCQKNSTTPPRCHSDQVDPLVNVLISQHSKLSENIYLKAMEQNAELHRMFEIRRQNCHGRFSSRK